MAFGTAIIRWGSFGLSCGVGMGIAFGDPGAGATAGVLSGMAMALLKRGSGGS